ncbi:MAG: hypothetical protein AAF611_16365 [Bacteroidota bacterium]
MRSVILTLIALYAVSSSATVQQKDVLIYNGNTYPLQEYYLEAYFECYPELRPKTMSVSSDLWRGYVAFFTVINKKIYLVDLQIRVKDENAKETFATTWKSVFKEFSPDVDEFPVDWIDDIIVLPHGEPLDYEQGFGIAYSEYELLEVKHGELLNSKKVSLEAYKKVVNKWHVFLRKKDLLLLKKKLID